MARTLRRLPTRARQALTLTAASAAALTIATAPAGAAPVAGISPKVALAPASGVTGGALATTIKLSNAGAKARPAGILRVYLSTDQAASRGTLIGQVKTAKLAGGKRRNEKVLGTIPATLGTGVYRVLAALDTTTTKCTAAAPCSRKGTLVAAKPIVITAPTPVLPPAPVITSTTTTAPANHAATATPDSYETTEDTQLVVTAAKGLLLNDSDADGDTFFAVLSSSPAHGVLTLNLTGAFVFTPAANYSGPDSFSYRVNDGHGYSAVATVTLTVTSVNDPPTAVADSYVTTEDNPLVIAAPGVLTNDTDPEHDPLTVEVITQPGHGAVSLDPAGGFTFTPAANYSGPDTFTYKVLDGNGGNTLGTVALKTTAINDAPVTSDDSYAMDKGLTLQVAPPGVLGNDTDADGGDPMTATLVSGPSHGTLNLQANGGFSYTPGTPGAPDYVGYDSFTYTASDGTATSAPTTVILTIGHPPVAWVDTYSVPAGTTFSRTAGSGLLSNDTDADGDYLNASLSGTGTSHGGLNLNFDGSFTYTPDPGYTGPDTFQYRAFDGTFFSSVMTVTFNVG